MPRSKSDILCGKPCHGNSIDEQVTEKKNELTTLYERFFVDGKCICPLCTPRKSKNNKG